MILQLGVAAGYGCGGDDTGDDDTDTNQNPSTDGNGMTPAATVKDDIDITPDVAHSGFDGEHTFVVPLKVRFGPATDWKCSDPDACRFEPVEGGVNVTILKAGEFTVTAKNGEMNGVSKIVSKQYNAADWQRGSDRYNNGVIPINIPDGGLPMGPPEMDGDGAMGDFDISFNPMAACAFCHGDTSRLRVRHTPTQIAKYSDEQVIAIFSMGMKPPGATFRIFPSNANWGEIHRWQMTPEDAQGILVYLRSLTPKVQEDLVIPGVTMTPARDLD